MKKLVCLMLVALVATVASAVTVQLQGPADVNPGDVVTISMFAVDGSVANFTILGISDGDAGGSAANPFIAPGFDFAMFNSLGVLNTEGLLVKNATGMTAFGSPPVTGLLYSFDYTVAADIAYGSVIIISADGNAENNPIASLSMNVIPEPMTIALLGLGGLFIRRRK